MKLLFVPILLTALASNARAVERPNILVVFTDDHGYADLSSQGIFEDVKTPHIDQLVASGVRMTSGYVTAPQCVPSRAGLISGQYQNRFGVESNGHVLDGFDAEQTIAERLKKAGYATGMTGKWHLGPPPEIPTHGFDDVYFKNANRPGWANFDLQGNDRPGGPEKSDRYHLDVNSDAACAFITRHHDKPFFFYCAYRAPHVPLDAPPRYLERFPGEMPHRRQQALAMLSAVDDGVGRILDTLRQYGLQERTLVFLIGDNGAPLKIHKWDAPGGGPGWDGSLNDPLNGEKGMLSEGGIRVPFVVSWKDQFEGGRLYDHPVISLDVAATAVALAGLEPDPKLDGVNLIPFLKGEAAGAPHETLYWRWISQSAVREGKWKYLRGGQREYLFDLDADREEKQNLLKEHPEIAQRLLKKLQAWSQQLNPPGLTTAPMATTWEQYFDYYLDGKPAPPRTAMSAAREIRRWIVRNGTGEIQKNSLNILPAKNAKQAPFIAQARLRISGPATATVVLRSTTGGRVGFSWRLDGQRDFVAGESAITKIDGSEEMQEVTLELPADGPIIHVRVLLPSGPSSIRRITLCDKSGHGQKTWDFDARP